MKEAVVGERRESRRIAMTAIYSSDITGYSFSEVLDLLRDMREDWHELPEFGELLARTVVEHSEEIEQTIAAVLEHWKIDRVAPVEKALLKMGCAEILYFPEIPPRVTINECIELAKKFANENAPSFINGILDKLVQERKKSDFTAPKKK
jgi:transcription antitermination protein NusB